MVRIIAQNLQVERDTSLSGADAAGEDAAQALAAASSSPRPANIQDLASGSTNTRRAYAADWKHFSAWCRHHKLSAHPPDPDIVGLYIVACASGAAERGITPNAVSTVERRLSSLSWNYAQRGEKLDRTDRAIATVMAGIRNQHAAPPRRRKAIVRQDLIAMLETLDRGTLRGLRDRTMLLLAFAGGLRRSEIVGLDIARHQTEDGRGWIEILDGGVRVSLRGKTGWRTVKIGRGSSDAACPVAMLKAWIHFAKISRGPLFRRVTARGREAGADRLNAQEVARLIRKTALATGARGKLAEPEPAQKCAGHTLRAAL